MRRVVLIEDKASGTQLIQELIADGCHGVTRYQPTSDKIMRLHAQTAMIENGFVHIPETAPWLAEYLHEMTVFPNGKHDDQVDSTAQFLDWFKTPFRARASSSSPARRAQEAGTTNRNPPRPNGPSAAWNGMPSRRKRGRPPDPMPHTRGMSSDTAFQLTSPWARNRKFETIPLRRKTPALRREGCALRVVLAEAPRTGTRL